MKLSATMLDALKERARSAAQRAYAPYSRFAVGAAVLTDGGEIYSAGNVENASYGLSMCAERNAILQAVAGGARTLSALVVYTATAAPTPPCGACRQVLAEFGPEALVICCTGADALDRRYLLAELLPGAFGPRNL
jgi:cytidine deaminase